jgi:hypothetical protein
MPLTAGEGMSGNRGYRCAPKLGCGRWELPVLPNKQKCRASAVTSALGQSTKSLRDSPLRGGLTGARGNQRRGRR